MGKNGFNKKARQQSQNDTLSKENNELQNLFVDKPDGYKNVLENDSNLLVAASKKLKAKKDFAGKQKQKKVLSKKERKRLQQIVDQKKKKEKVSTAP